MQVWLLPKKCVRDLLYNGPPAQWDQQLYPKEWPLTEGFQVFIMQEQRPWTNKLSVAKIMPAKSKLSLVWLFISRCSFCYDICYVCHTGCFFSINLYFTGLTGIPIVVSTVIMNITHVRSYLHVIRIQYHATSTFWIIHPVGGQHTVTSHYSSSQIFT